jgi:hypothetical protein
MIVRRNAGKPGRLWLGSGYSEEAPGCFKEVALSYLTQVTGYNHVAGQADWQGFQQPPTPNIKWYWFSWSGPAPRYHLSKCTMRPPIRCGTGNTLTHILTQVAAECPFYGGAIATASAASAVSYLSLITGEPAYPPAVGHPLWVPWCPL